VAWYRCLVRGEGFPLVLEGEELDLFGFYTTRFVDASSPDDAEHIATRLILADPSLVVSMGAPAADGARLYFESVDRVDEQGAPNGGFTFYRMKDA
jgi:hypothetical protein